MRGWIGGVMALALTASACSGNEARQPAASGAARSVPADGPMAIDVSTVVERPLDVQLTLSGELTAYQAVDIHARVTGFVKSVAVDRGSVVKAGQVLAVLEAPELVAQRAEAESKRQAAEAALAVARANAESARGTADKLKAASATPGVVAGNDLAIAQKTADAAASQVAAAEQGAEAARQASQAVRDLEGYLRIPAPFDGVVTERTVHPGALVGPSTAPGATPLLRVVEQRRLRLVVAVPEAYIGQVPNGVEVTFTVSAYPGQPFTGKVARVAHSVDVATRTMAVELDVANADGRLAPGTFAQVRWPVRRAAASLFVPSGSVASTTDRTFVVRVRGGKAEWVDVRTGLTAGPLIEVFGDLQAGDEVASRGTDEVRPGTDVRARPAKPAA